MVGHGAKLVEAANDRGFEWAVSVREIRDPIHGFLRVQDSEARVIDTSIFQRLRRIRQLATAYLVYPGATHSRFEHSLGCMHVADRMLQALVPEADSDRERYLRLAALLHDLGHAPFSHVSEAVMQRHSRASLSDAGSQEKIHECITHEIIRRDSELSGLVSEYDREKVIGLLRGTDEHIDSSILSGPIDADKQDYLLRDSYYCGVKYGVFDIDRLMAVLCFQRLKHVCSPSEGTERSRRQISRRASTPMYAYDSRGASSIWVEG